MLGTGDSPFPLEGPWQATSPTLRKRITFDDEELWRECERMAQEAAASGGKFTAGQSLFQQLPHCANPRRLFDPDAARWLEDWRMSKALGVPVAATLGEVEADYAEAALVIEREMQVAVAFAAKRS